MSSCFREFEEFRRMTDDFYAYCQAVADCHIANAHLVKKYSVQINCRELVFYCIAYGRNILVFYCINYGRNILFRSIVMSWVFCCINYGRNKLCVVNAWSIKCLNKINMTSRINNCLEFSVTLLFEILIYCS